MTKFISWLAIGLLVSNQAIAASTTANMLLSNPSVGDTDYPTSVSDSFNLIDAHDHTTGKGVQIPSGGIANGAITVNKPASSSADGSTIEVSSGAYRVKDGGITAAKLASTLGVVPAGAVQYYLGTSAPAGYFLGQGQQVSRTTYSDLYAVVGTAYGSGDGATTFNLPDCRGMFIRGQVGYTSTTFASATDVNTGTDVITVSGGHNLNRSGFPVRLTTSSALPTGLSLATTYYVIYVSSTTLKLATTEANALAGTAIDITGTGTGTQTISQYIDPEASSRTADSTGGNTGTSIGAKQQNTTAKNGLSATDSGHSHGLKFSAGDDGGVNAGDLAYIPFGPTDRTAPGAGNRNGVGTITTWPSGYPIVNGTAAISVTGDTETRPQNITMNCIIKY